MRTEVMTLGNVNAEGQYVYPPVPAGGMPGYGGPTSTYDYGAQEPLWLTNRMPMPPVSPQQPQNLLRPTYKGMSPKMSSTGKSVYALYGLGTAFASPQQTAQEQQQENEALRSMLMVRSVAYAAIGGTLAALQLKDEKVRGGGMVAGVLAGVLFPVLFNGGYYLYRK